MREKTRQHKVFRETLDEVLGEMIWDDPRPAAEAVAESLGLYWERDRGSVSVYTDGQRPRQGWRRALTLGARGLWAWGGVVHVQESYKPGGMLIPHRIVYK